MTLLRYDDGLVVKEVEPLVAYVASVSGWLDEDGLAALRHLAACVSWSCSSAPHPTPCPNPGQSLRPASAVLLKLVATILRHNHDRLT
ncbi:MAG: hypothetical protein IPJ58_17565 [Ardenticatenia bacterium]|nr:hypothetical protein [Ardenticatenia bacterium]